MRKGGLGDLAGCGGLAATGRCRKAGFVSTIRCGLARAVLGFFAMQVGKPKGSWTSDLGSRHTRTWVRQAVVQIACLLR
jgi:hypothetical protein